MAKVSIRTASAEKNIVLSEAYTLEEVIDEIEEAASTGKSVVVFDLDRGGKTVISIGGTEPFTVREVTPGRVVGF